MLINIAMQFYRDYHTAYVKEQVKDDTAMGISL